MPDERPAYEYMILTSTQRAGEGGIHQDIAHWEESGWEPFSFSTAINPHVAGRKHGQAPAPGGEDDPIDECDCVVYSVLMRKRIGMHRR